MLPDFLPAAEVLAKGVRHVACYVADAITERCKAFDDDEAGDYLRCAGADALAEALCRVEEEQEVHEPEVCYFCDRPTNRIALFGGPSVCDRCADIATTSPTAATSPPLAAVTDPAAAEAFPPSMTAAGSSNFMDCGLFHPDMDEHLTSVAELDWPAVGAALRVIADFFDPK